MRQIITVSTAGRQAPVDLTARVEQAAGGSSLRNGRGRGDCEVAGSRIGRPGLRNILAADS